MSTCFPVKNAPLDSLSPESQQRLAEVLEKYLNGLEQGAPPDVEELVGQYPDLAEPLREYLGSLDFVHQAAAARPARASPSRPSGNWATMRSGGKSAAAGWEWSTKRGRFPWAGGWR